MLEQRHEFMIQTAKQTKKAQAIRNYFAEQHCFGHSVSQLQPPILNYYNLPNGIGDTIHSGLFSSPVALLASDSI